MLAESSGLRVSKEAPEVKRLLNALARRWSSVQAASGSKRDSEWRSSCQGDAAEAGAPPWARCTSSLAASSSARARAKLNMPRSQWESSSSPRRSTKLDNNRAGDLLVPSAAKGRRASAIQAATWQACRCKHGLHHVDAPAS